MLEAVPYHLLSIHFVAFENSFATLILKTPTIGEIKSIFGKGHHHIRANCLHFRHKNQTWTIILNNTKLPLHLIFDIT